MTNPLSGRRAARARAATGRSHIASWVLVALVSLSLIWGIGATWRATVCCNLEGLDPVTDRAQVAAILQQDGSDALIQVTTGIYVQSLSFESANDVQVTGRLWQRVPPGIVLPPGGHLGVLFPDAISSHDGNLTQLYEDFVLPDGSHLDTWKFQVLLRQDFNYSAYPLDGKLVWIRFWTDDIEEDIQLVPDLGAFSDVSPETLPGISESLVPGEWQVLQTFFSYDRLKFETDFGLNEQAFPLPPSRPELRFNIILKRNFIDAFVVNLVPLAVIFGLLFGLMLTVSRDSDRASRTGFNTLAVFGSAAGLFFIALLGHIQVRQQFAGSQIVYIEYFYILAYLMLLSISVFSFMVTHADHENESWVLRDDGRLLKMLYWPFVLGAALVITVARLPVDAHGVWQALF